MIRSQMPDLCGAPLPASSIKSLVRLNFRGAWRERDTERETDRERGGGGEGKEIQPQANSTCSTSNMTTIGKIFSQETIDL
jgi:hypothetical protein